MSIYAIGDLHLSLDNSKPMDVFGDNWKNHMEKIKDNSINRNVVMDNRIDNLVVQLVITEEWNDEIINKLTISELQRLESIIVKKKSCIHVSSLVISNNQNLKEICFEKGDAWNGVSFNAAFENTQSFILSGITFYQNMI